MAIKVCFNGNMTRDVQSRQVGGQKVYSFSVASRTASKGEDGSYITNFFDCSFWGKRGEYFSEHAKKGNRVVIWGDLAQVEYTGRDGTKRTSMRVVVDAAELTERSEHAAAKPAEKKADPTDDLPF